MFKQNAPNKPSIYNWYNADSTQGATLALMRSNTNTVNFKRVRSAGTRNDGTAYTLSDADYVKEVDPVLRGWKQDAVIQGDAFASGAAGNIEDDAMRLSPRHLGTQPMAPSPKR